MCTLHLCHRMSRKLNLIWNFFPLRLTNGGAVIYYLNKLIHPIVSHQKQTIIFHGYTTRAWRVWGKTDKQTNKTWKSFVYNCWSKVSSFEIRSFVFITHTTHQTEIFIFAEKEQKDLFGKQQRRLWQRWWPSKWNNCTKSYCSFLSHCHGIWPVGDEIASSIIF